MNCPACSCPTHQAPRTWEVRCSVCGELRWPSAASKPDPYTCGRCLGTSAARREAARLAGQKSAARRAEKGGSALIWVPRGGLSRAGNGLGAAAQGAGL